jgi:hypothetical protein
MSTVNRSIITDGLILCLDVGNTKSFVSGSTTWNDISRNTNNGTLTNGPLFNSVYSRGIQFDGLDDYIQGTTILQPTDQFTISAWYKSTGAPSTNDSVGGFILCADPQLAHGYILTHSWLNQTVTFSHVVNAGLTTTNGSAPNNQIINVVGTWNGTTRSIYVNGALVITQSYSSAIVYPGSGDRNFRIGMWGYSSFSRNFNGILYNISLYNKGLTNSEVLQNYNVTKTRFGL